MSIAPSIMRLPTLPCLIVRFVACFWLHPRKCREDRTRSKHSWKEGGGVFDRLCGYALLKTEDLYFNAMLLLQLRLFEISTWFEIRQEAVYFVVSFFLYKRVTLSELSYITSLKTNSINYGYVIVTFYSHVPLIHVNEYRTWRPPYRQWCVSQIINIILRQSLRLGESPLIMITSGVLETCLEHYYSYKILNNIPAFQTPPSPLPFPVSFHQR